MTPINQLLRGEFSQTISGTIVSIREDEFILGDATGQILVDANWERFGRINLAVGDQITVTGEYDDDDFDAYSITRSNSVPVSSSANSLILQRIVGSSGDDQMLGGAGADELEGSFGNDSIYGFENNDTLDGSSGNDFLFGNVGNDNLDGEEGNDSLFGGRDNDILDGDIGNDFLFGNIGNDSLDGENGDDVMYGGRDNDSLEGDSGNDFLSGDLGNDRVEGEEGNDTLIGVGPSLGSGETDVLIGGAGVDRFVLGEGNNRFYDDQNAASGGLADFGLIVDFNATQDIIQLSGSAGNYFLATTPAGVPQGTAIYLDKPASEPDELIAVIQGSVNLNLGAGYFNFL